MKCPKCKKEMVKGKFRKYYLGLPDFFIEDDSPKLSFSGKVLIGDSDESYYCKACDILLTINSNDNKHK